MTQTTRFEKTIKVKRNVANEEELRLRAMEEYKKAAKKQFKKCKIIDFVYKKVYKFTAGHASSYIEYKIIGNVIWEKGGKKK